jgi:hypothetical protein
LNRMSMDAIPTTRYRYNLFGFNLIHLNSHSLLSGGVSEKS